MINHIKPKEPQSSSLFVENHFQFLPKEPQSGSVFVENNNL